MPSVEAVEEALVQAGEWRSQRRVGGFFARSHAVDVVVVRWQPPVDQPDAGDAIAFIEEYAQILRNAGIPATVILDAAGPRVLCLPDTLAQDRLSHADELIAPRLARAANN